MTDPALTGDLPLLLACLNVKYFLNILIEYRTHLMNGASP